MYKSKRPERGDRGCSPVSKRSRSSLGRYNNDPDSEEEKVGRGGGRSPMTGGRGRDRDYYESSSRNMGGYKDGGGYVTVGLKFLKQGFDIC